MEKEYALSLAKDGRILSVTYPEYASENAIIVGTLPEGDKSDYRYIDGQFILDPLPKPEPPAPTQTTEERIKTLESKNEALTASNQFLEDCIAEMAGIVYA